MMFQRATTCLLIVALLATSHVASAQFFIDLSKEKLDIPDCGVQVDSVVVAFDPTQPIGEVEDGGHTREAYMSTTLGQDLNALFTRCLQALPSKRHVVIKVNELRIAEHSLRDGEIAFCSLSLDVVERNDSGWTILYDHGTTRSMNAFDAASVHAENIANAVRECLKGFAQAEAKGGLHHTTIALQDISRPTDPHIIPMPIVEDTMPQRGVYHTFMDFRNNTPDTRVRFTLKEAPTSSRLSQRMEFRTKGQYTGAIWGCCDNGHCYVNTGYRMITLNRNGRGFSARVTAEERFPNKEESTVRGITAILMPLAIVPFMLGDVMSTSAAIDADLDMLSGALMVSAHAAMMPSRLPVRVEQVVLLKEAPANESICLFIYGGSEGCLRSGQYRTIKLVPRPEGVPLEIRTINGQILTVRLDTNASEAQVYEMSFDEQGLASIAKLDRGASLLARAKLKPENEVK